jgi:hypothetical protein
LRKHKFQNQVEALQETLQLEENQYKHIDPTIEELRAILNNMKFQLNQNKGKEKREVVWCTLCRTKGHHQNLVPKNCVVLGRKTAKSLTDKRTMV